MWCVVRTCTKRSCSWANADASTTLHNNHNTVKTLLMQFPQYVEG